jgi:hypothetical protein
MDLKTLVANLRRDADELERLDKVISGLGGDGTGSNTSRRTGMSVGGKRKGFLDARARAAISRAQKARWAKIKAGKKG